MLDKIKKLGLSVAVAAFIVTIGLGTDPAQESHATPTTTQITDRITALTGLQPAEIDAMYAAEQRADVLIIAYDVSIPIVLEPLTGYLLVRVAATQQWIRVLIDQTEWRNDFRPYLESQGVAVHQQPVGTIDQLTAAQEAADIAASGSISGEAVANIILYGSLAGPINSVGSTPYGIDVGADGDAVISVPIDSIPGVAGFAPELSIHYDSGRGTDRLERSLPEDTLGYGWRLAGLSQIRRCVVNQSSSNSISLTNSDSLCLDGMPLVLTSGTHFAVGAVYRTLIESYARIEAKGASGALWFEVTLPDGSVREYGNGTGSRVDQNGGVDFQWSISKALAKATAADPSTIDYTYVHDAGRGINYVSRIEYTGAAIEFEYLTRTDAAAVAIGSATQTQSMFLRKVLVKYDNKNVREYRILSSVVSNRRRLNDIQLCGYDKAGTTSSCLKPLEFDWVTPTSTMPGVPILVSGMTDSLGADHQIEYGTITSGSHSFLFTERPFGNGSPPANTQLLSGSGALRHVATKLRRDNGLGGFHDTTYAYQDKGLVSTRHWGFLGFYAQRIRDEVSGIVTYAQFRMDYPYFGRIARVHQLDATYGSHTKTLTRSETAFSQQSIAHSTGTTVYPYLNSSIDFIYEGTTQLGARRVGSGLTFSSGFVSQAVTTVEYAKGASAGSSGGAWGDVPTYTLSNLLNTAVSTVAFTNRTTSGQWLINFPNAVTRESWPGAPSGAGIVQDATFMPHASSLRPQNITKYPDDPNLTLSTTIAYDDSGRPFVTTISGDDVFTRQSRIPSFIDDRYPYQLINPKDQATTFNSYDHRFGTVENRGSIIGRNSSWTRDPFGRVASYTNADNVVTTTTYTDCPTGCGVSVYGVSPRYYAQTESTAASDQLAPIQRTYFDELDRVIRTEVQPFAGSDYNKQDVKYDALGRIDRSSLPYQTGTSKDVILTYDIRNRVATVSRPDGGSTITVYSASGNEVIETITENVKYADGSSAGTQVKRNEYNILGQLAKTTDGYGSSTDPSTSYTYDANGNIRTVVVDGGGDGTATTTMKYDAAGNQTEIIGPNIGTVTSTYNGLNELRTRLDNKGQLTSYYYDTLQRLTGIANVDGNSSWVWDSATNGAGQLKSRSGPGFSETYWYNSDGRLRKVDTSIVPIDGGTQDYTTIHTYDTHGRPSTTTYPGGFVLTREYNARGYLSKLKDGATAIHTINDMDAFGNRVDESYANGVGTVRTFDPETGRLTDINTTKGSTVIQNNDYAWRSNGTLESRTANPSAGWHTTRKETFGYDVLNRVVLAETYVNENRERSLDYLYDDLGNLESKTSTRPSDTSVNKAIYGGGTAGPHALTRAETNEGGWLSHTLTYDLNGAVTKYDTSGTHDDKYIAYNANNQPTTIVIGSSLTDSTPAAKDEFAYGPNGQRYAGKTSWQEGAGTITEKVAYIGSVEIISSNADPDIQTITKTRLSDSVMHVKIEGTATTTFFEYAHRDHLGSIDIVTDDSGNVLDRAAFDPFGSRKRTDWLASITASELGNLLSLDTDHTRKVRGFTGHEHLDRTGFIHMNGRLYDPFLGRFLSPDPFVQFPANSQSWNRYSYVGNTPTSFTDPSGFRRDDHLSQSDDGARGSAFIRSGLLWLFGGRGHALVPNDDQRNRETAASGICAVECVSQIPTNPTEVELSVGDFRNYIMSTGGFGHIDAPSFLGTLGMHWEDQGDIQGILEGLRSYMAIRDAWQEAMGLHTGTPSLLPARGPAAAINMRNLSRGWRLGDDVNAVTARGNAPAWSTIRGRFWKNEVASPNAVEKYGAENVERMRRGLAPQRYNADKGAMESMELSHEPIPLRDGGRQFVPRWPQDHAAVDPFRRPGY